MRGLDCIFSANTEPLSVVRALWRHGLNQSWPLTVIRDSYRHYYRDGRDLTTHHGGALPTELHWLNLTKSDIGSVLKSFTACPVKSLSDSFGKLHWHLVCKQTVLTNLNHGDPYLPRQLHWLNLTKSDIGSVLKSFTACPVKSLSDSFGKLHWH